MARPPELVEESRPRVAQVLGLELHERGAERVVVARDLEREAVGFVLVVPRVGEGHRGDQEREQVGQQDEEGQGGDIGQGVKAHAP